MTQPPPPPPPRPRSIHTTASTQIGTANRMFLQFYVYHVHACNVSGIIIWCQVMLTTVPNLTYNYYHSYIVRVGITRNVIINIICIIYACNISERACDKVFQTTCWLYFIRCSGNAENPGTCWSAIHLLASHLRAHAMWLFAHRFSEINNLYNIILYWAHERTYGCIYYNVM